MKGAVMEVNVGDRCPGCGVVCAHLDVEHLDNCVYLGKLTLLVPSTTSDRSGRYQEGGSAGV